MHRTKPVQGTVTLSPNQIVALNLRRLREERRWSLEETGKKLKDFGYTLTRQALSQWESVVGRKIHRFDADEIVALVRLFEGISVGGFFGPPYSHLNGRVIMVNSQPGRTGAKVNSKPLTRQQMLQLALHESPLVYSGIAEVLEPKLVAAFRDQVVRYLREDKDRAEKIAGEYLRSHQSNEPSTCLIKAYSDVKRQFVKELEESRTPHGEAKLGQDVLDHFNAEPNLRPLIRNDASSSSPVRKSRRRSSK